MSQDHPGLVVSRRQFFGGKDEDLRTDSSLLQQNVEVLERPLEDAEPSRTLAGRLGLVAPVAVLALAACKKDEAGEDPTPPTLPPPTPTPPPVVAPPPVLVPTTDAEAARFLNQAQFSASTSEIAAVRQLGYTPWLNQEMSRPIAQTAAQRLAAINSERPDNPGNGGALFADGQNVVWRDLMSAPDAVRKRIAFALSELFVVSTESSFMPWEGTAYGYLWDILNRNAFGNFRTLMEEITLSPVMGIYLNMNRSFKEDPATGRRPDENYARELMQLFTIGLVQLNLDGTPRLGSDNQPIPTYTMDDVTGVARALTGWAFDGAGTVGSANIPPEIARIPMTSDSSRYLFPAPGNQHSTLEARFLGVTVPANTSAPNALRIVLDTLFNHPNVGPFVGRQMIQRLVTSNPSPAYVSRVASVFNNNGAGVRGDLRAMFLAILTDQEARNPTALNNAAYGKLREPLMRFFQWARTFNVRSTDDVWNVGDTVSASQSLGQQPFRAPSVFNFFRPGFVPAGTGIASNNLVAPEFQIANEVANIGYLNFMQNVIANGLRGTILPDYTAEIAIANDPPALVNRIILLMSANQISSTVRDMIVQAVQSVTLPTTNDTAARRNRVYIAILLTMASSQYLIQK